MKAFVFICFCSLFLLTAPASVCQDKKSDFLVIKAKVEDIEKSRLGADEVPSHNSYLVVTYKVLKVCEGVYPDALIKVAHRGDSADKLKVGDEMYRQLEPTTRYRDFARSMLEVFGVLIPEKSLADFDVIEGNQTFSCPE